MNIITNKNKPTFLQRHLPPQSLRFLRAGLVGAFILATPLIANAQNNNPTGNTNTDTHSPHSPEITKAMSENIEKIMTIAQQLIDDDGVVRSLTTENYKTKLGAYTDSSQVSVLMQNNTSLNPERPLLKSDSKFKLQLETNQFKVTIEEKSDGRIIIKNLLRQPEGITLPSAFTCTSPEMREVLRVKEESQASAIFNILVTLENVQYAERTNNFENISKFFSDDVEQTIGDSYKWDNVKE